MKKLIFNMLALFVTTFMLAATPSYAVDFFTDLERDHWAYKHVMDLQAQGIVVGYPDGSFRPDENVTRAEFAAIVVKALNLQNNGDIYPIDYRDLSTGYWAYNVIQIASHYGLVTGTPDGYFWPNDPVRRVEIIMVIMNSLAIKELTPEASEEYLSKYEDADEVPAWALLRTAKAEQLEMMVTPPGSDGQLEPMRPATRAEVVAFVYNMLERAKIHPNKKIAAGLPRMADGYVLDNVYMDGTTAIIPAGTILPLGIMTHTDSKEVQVGDEFTARALKHFVNKDSILLIPVGTRFSGKVEKVKKGIPVIRNAEMVFVTSDMLDQDGVPASVFPAVADTCPVLFKTDFWEKFNYYVFKGRDFIVHRSQVKEFILLDTIKVDVMKNWIYH